MSEPAGATEPVVLIEDLIPGIGKTVQKGALIKAHYRGFLSDGSEFDSSYSQGEPFETVLSRNRVIQGWVQGLQGMQQGGTRRLTVPAVLAYGEREVKTALGVIPPHSDLVFVIELLEVWNRGD